MPDRPALPGDPGERALIWTPVTAAFGVPDTVRNTVTTVATGGVAMVIILAIDKTIFRRGLGQRRRRLLG